MPAGEKSCASTEIAVAKPAPTCYNSNVRRVGISVLQRLPKPLRRVRLPYPAPKKVHDESRGLFLPSTRRSASRLDSDHLTAEVNSAYCNSPLRCELTRDFARGTCRTLKSTGASELPLCKCFCAAKAFYGAKAPRLKARGLRRKSSQARCMYSLAGWLSLMLKRGR